MKTALARDLLSTSRFIASASFPQEFRQTGQFREILTSTGSMLAGGDMDQARTWVSSLSPEEQPFAVAGMASQWVKRDPGAATSWIEELPSGANRDAAIMSLVRELEGSDPEAAAAWKNSIGK